MIITLGPNEIESEKPIETTSQSAQRQSDRNYCSLNNQKINRQ